MTNLQRVHYYFRDFESPQHFITWTYLYMIASCLGRKVHLQDLSVGIFPNIYLFIVGPPAVGKSIQANILCRILASLMTVGKDGKTPIPIVNITPTCVTLEALYEYIEGATRSIKTKHGNPEFYYHASVSFALGDEIGLLFKHKDATNDIVSFLLAGYDNGEFDYKTKKSGSNKIRNMCVNFLGCCTPTWITRSLTSDMIGEGLTSRTIFLWGDKKRQSTSRIKIYPDQIAAMEEVKKHFVELSKLQGEVAETKEAFKFFDDWYHEFEAKKIRINSDKKLEYYYGRKKLHVQKLAMLCHFSERLNMQLDVWDYQNALALLNRAEIDMHKALAVASRNPLNTLAEQIKKIIYVDGIASRKKILAKCFDGGNADEIKQATDFLIETGQVRVGDTGLVLLEDHPDNKPPTDEEGVESSQSSVGPASAYQLPEPLPNFLPASGEYSPGKDETPSGPMA